MSDKYCRNFSFNLNTTRTPRNVFEHFSNALERKLQILWIRENVVIKCWKLLDHLKNVNESR